MRIRRHKRKSAVTVATVSATEAVKTFGGLVDRVRESGAAYIIERQGTPVAQLGPIARRRCTLAELADWFEGRGATGPEFTAAVRAHVAAANRPRVPSSRWRS